MMSWFEYTPPKMAFASFVRCFLVIGSSFTGEATSVIVLAVLPGGI